MAVLSDAERMLKVGVSAPHHPYGVDLRPRPYPLLPSGLTAIAGADAMTHAIEAYTAIRRAAVPGIARDRVLSAENDFSDHLALRAIVLLWEGLETACKDGSNAAAREKVMMGATLAGPPSALPERQPPMPFSIPSGLTHTAHGSGSPA